MMRFEHPWLLLLVPIAMIAWFLLRRREDRKPPALLWGRTGGYAPRLSAVPLRVARALPVVAMVVAIVSLARPQQGVSQSEIASKGVDIVIAIDISPSMRAEDMGAGNRLDVAKATAREFVKGRSHDRIGAVGFAATAFTQCPLTLDHDTLADLLAGLEFGLAEDGTAIGMGLATAVQRLRDSRSPSKVVVLLTDGENNRGAIDPATAADLARAMQVKVYTVLVGRRAVAPITVDDPVLGATVRLAPVNVEEAPLIDIAKRTGGRFFRASDATALSGIYGEIDRLERAPIRSVVYREYRDLGPMFLVVASVLLGVWAVSATSWARTLP